MATINDYTKTEWVNDTTPAIDAEHLNKIEEGIYDNRVAVNELLTDIDTKAPSVSPTLKFAVMDSADGNTNPHAEFRTMGNSPSKSVGFAVYDENGNGTYYDLIKGDGTRYFATVPEVNLKAPLASPALTGTPTAPTASVGTNTTQIATTAYVQSSLDGWRFYDKDAFSTSTSLATICSSLPNYSIWIKNIASVNDFGGLPSVGLLQITKFTASRCILELNYVTASATHSRKYVASYASTPGTISAWKELVSADLSGIGNRVGRAVIGDLQILWGTTSITPSAANTPTSKEITFSNAFATNPTVQVSVLSSLIGTQILGVSVGAVTTTSFTACTTRTNTSNVVVNWLAIGQAA